MSSEYRMLSEEIEKLNAEVSRLKERVYHLAKLADAAKDAYKAGTDNGVNIELDGTSIKWEDTEVCKKVRMILDGLVQ